MPALRPWTAISDSGYKPFEVAGNIPALRPWTTINDEGYKTTRGGGQHARPTTMDCYQRWRRQNRWK
jgi:hypothetical protein